MNTKIAVIAGAVAAAYLAPGIASASFVLDTGTPTGTGAPEVLSTAQFLAGEFAVTAGENITELSAYLTQGAGQPGDTFTFDIYSGSGLIARNASPVFSTTGTFTTNGWNSAAVNWTPTTTGDYWLALQVASTTDTKGLDAPTETSTSTGTAPALAFAYSTGGSAAYKSTSTGIGLEVTAASPVPLPAGIWLLGSGVLGLGAMARRRRSGVQAA
jgi:hypothetical protein